MTREEFRIVPLFYTTNSLTYIFHKDTIIHGVEIWKDLFFVDDKAMKKKRTKEEIDKECESFIKKYIYEKTSKR